MVVLWVVEVGITVAVAGASDAVDTFFVVVIGVDVGATAVVDEFACVIVNEFACVIVNEFACVIVNEFACVIVDELAAADMDELDAFTDEFEAYTCCMQHIKNNANFRRWGKVICKSESKKY